MLCPPCGLVPLSSHANINMAPAWDLSKFKFSRKCFYKDKIQENIFRVYDECVERSRYQYRDINVLEQRLCLRLPRLLLGGVIKAKLRQTVVKPSESLRSPPQSPLTFAQLLLRSCRLSPRTANAACTYLGCHPTHPTGDTYNNGPGMPNQSADREIPGK